MSRPGTRARGRGTSGIDITPLIDVLFMLIIFFVLTTAFVQGSITVDLPEGSPPPMEQRDPIVVTVTESSGYLWGGEEIARADIAARAKLAREAGDDLLIAGDRSARFGDVAELLDELRSAGIDGVGIAFDGAADANKGDRANGGTSRRREDAE